MRILTRRQAENRIAWLLLAPILAYFILFMAFPALAGFLLGFMKWVGVGMKPRFAGLANFARFFSDQIYLRTLWNAFFIGTIVMLVNILLGLVGALLLNVDVKGRTLIRSIWYAPAVTATVAVSQIFLMFIDPSAGVANRVLGLIGIKPITWVYSQFWMVCWIVLYSSWRGIGGCMILWLAGLQSVDPSLYEAASVEGVNAWQELWHISLPCLRGIIAYIVITGFIAALQIFEPVLFISHGGPFGGTEVIVYRIYRDFYGDFNFGMAGASSLVITAILVVFSLVTARWYALKEAPNG